MRVFSFVLISLLNWCVCDAKYGKNMRKVVTALANFGELPINHLITSIDNGDRWSAGESSPMSITP